MVVIPGAEGEMGVLPGHAPMIVMLRGGAIRVLRERRGDRAGCSSRGGFAEVTPERVTVLADEASAAGRACPAQPPSAALAEAEAVPRRYRQSATVAGGREGAMLAAAPGGRAPMA